MSNSNSNIDYFARRGQTNGSASSNPNDGRPQISRLQSVNPTYHETNTSVPVTPGIQDWAEIDRPYLAAQAEDARREHRESVSQNRPVAVDDPETSNSHARRPSSPSELAAGARSPEEVLRRLSLNGPGQKASSLEDIDPAQYPNLGLTGNIISATFCVPYKVAYVPGEDWQLNSRRGTSALFDSFAFLASEESKWSHTLVGWTGEFEVAAPDNNQGTSMNAVPLNKASAPIPISSHHKAPVPNDSAEIKVPEVDRRRLEKQLEHDHGGRVAPVWLSDDVDSEGVAHFSNQRKWRRFAEHELFPLFHYKQNEPTDGRAVKKAWAQYYKMNRAFADAIMNVYKPGDVVMIHDYHLLLLPSLLRQRLPNIYIGFFLHVPFPSSEFYRCLSRRKEVLEGVLGSNMIGFQAYSYSRHFSSCCTRVLGFDSSVAGVDAYGAHVSTDVFPLGIGAEATLKAAFEDKLVEEKIVHLRELYHDKKIIVGRDRLDSVRGVAQKLQAFEIFLERHPEWHDKVVLIQVTSPTSIEDREDSGSDKVANKISDLVARINGTYGSLSFTPVQHYSQYLSKEEYFALLRIADVGLITSVRDGMNTTALEYVACQRDSHGPLIISEFSGTAGSLGNAMHINPWDLGGTADAIEVALTMSEQEKARVHRRLFDHVTSNTVQNWTTSYLKRLLTNLAAFDQSHATPLLDRAKLLSQYRKAKKRLFMFDYDGTLTPIVKEPQAAIPSDRVIRNLKQLAANPNNAVWIISGRDQSFLDEWMGHIPELGLSAEHGSFMRLPHTTEWENLAEHYDMEWQKAVMKVFQYYTERTQGSFIERKKIALTWHYRRADHELGIFQAKECQKKLEQTVAKDYEVEVMPGKANLEVRPRFVNKGEIAKRLVNEYGAEEGQAPEFVLCLGDDFTDEGKLIIKNSLALQHTDSPSNRHVPLPPRFLAARRPRLRSDRRRQLQADHRFVALARAFRRDLCPFAAQRQHRWWQRRCGHRRRGRDS
jgi:trehalose 6-phosphate synthase/phosphatase